mmetsp:Transcript_14635/g.47655  ORF Transcript_14635/g.47655 Transcript_14635/m.47655 type:complete len:420 (+) Transcript_14635:62-1321(+)
MVVFFGVSSSCFFFAAAAVLGTPTTPTWGSSVPRETEIFRSLEWRRPPFSRTAVLVAGQVRTGIFAAVQANIREAVFAPLQGTDLFWVVSETPPEPVEAWIGAVLRGWGGPALLRNVFLDFWSPADARAVEARSRRATDPRNGASLRDCRPARAPFLAIAAGFRRLLRAEADDAARYEWILRIRPDMVHSKRLPELDAWPFSSSRIKGGHHRAAYVDGWRWARVGNCSCFCAGDRFAVVHRDLAAVVFQVADDFLDDFLDDAPHDVSKRRRRQKECPDLVVGENCYRPETHLIPECAFGAALVEAGLDPDRHVRRLHSGSLLSCGPTNKTTTHRATDAEPCEAPYWRPTGRRKDLAASLRDKPIPPLKSQPAIFWRPRAVAWGGGNDTYDDFRREERKVTRRRKHIREGVLRGLGKKAS